jgi:hypothetical protein
MDFKMRADSVQSNRAPGRVCRANLKSSARACDRAVRRLIVRLSIALIIGAAASPAPADTVLPGPVIVLPDDVIIPVPARPSNADPMNPASPADVVTQRYNNMRTGTTLSGGLDQLSVSDPRFGLLGHVDVRGAVLAQPLFMAGVNFPQGRRSAVFIADSFNWVYAFDAVTLEKLWEHHLGDPYIIQDPWNAANPENKNCPSIMTTTEQDDQVAQNQKIAVLGIESTPVIDLANSRIIVSYRGMDGIPGGTPRIAALDLLTGNPAKGPDGRDLDRRITDNPLWNQVHRNRASLLLDGGHVYVGFSGRCEEADFSLANKAYQGWIYAFNASTLAFAYRYRSTQQPDGTPPQEPTDDPIVGGGIWQASTGLAADGHGNLYFTTGNQSRCGVPGDATPLKCSAPDSLGKNLSNSVVRLRVDPEAGGPPDSITMTLADWFTPYRKTWLDFTDLDFAAAGVVLIPNTRYLVAGGKEGMLYVLDRDHLGKFDGSTPFDASTVVAGPSLHTSGDPVGLDDPRRDHVVQKLRAAENKYCADDPDPLFCLDVGENYPDPPTPRPAGVSMNRWIPWPHIHGTPVFGAFPDGRAFLYLWAEKDRLKSFQWWGKRFDSNPTEIATNKAGAVVLAPPFLRESTPGAGSIGMPGGMLALSIDPAQAAAGVLFASVQRCRVTKDDPAFQINRDDPGFHECSVDDCRTSTATLSVCGQQHFGMLRAFNPFTLRELWNNQSDPSVSDEDRNYWFAKFVPPTIANGRVFLPTASKRVLVYGIKQ